MSTTGGAPQRWGPADAGRLVAVPDERSDKYRRGVLGLRTGSSAYPGAAVLGAEAAWRTGVGLVRYTPPLGDPEPGLGLPSPAAAVLAARPETVFLPGHAARQARCDAWLIGSGTDPGQRSFAEREALRALLAGDAPVVVDAGALGELTAVGAEAGPPRAATPHRGELLALWAAAELGDPPDRDPASDAATAAETAARLAERLGATVLLKGSVTVAATPGGFRAAIGPATPWLATAGTGDVLAGILGALATTHAAELRSDAELFGALAASAAALHDLAARIAAGARAGGGAGDAIADPARRGRPIAALDVARAIPEAVAAAIAAADA